jgi:hypothetical protein
MIIPSGSIVKYKNHAWRVRSDWDSSQWSMMELWRPITGCSLGQRCFAPSAECQIVKLFNADEAKV